MKGKIVLALLVSFFPAEAQEALRELLPAREVVATSAGATIRAQTGGGEPVTLGDQVLRRSALPSVADVLRREAGLNFTSFFGSLGTGAPQLRGFADGASSRVLILIDGLPANRPDLAGPVWFEFPLASLDKVELIRGSRTVRWGSPALAGVISLETRGHTGAREWSFQSSLGSWDTSLFRLNGRLPTGHGWTARVSLDRYESDGWRENSGTRSHAAQVSLSSPEDRPWQWLTTFHFGQTDLENPGGLGLDDYRANPRQSLYTRFGIGNQYENSLSTRRWTHQIRFCATPDQVWQLNASSTGRLRKLNFGAGSHTDHDLDTLAIDLSHRWSADRFATTWGFRATLDTLFLERFHDQTRRTRFATANLDRSSLGGFVRSDYDLNPTLTFSGGFSLDVYDLAVSARDLASPPDPALNFDNGTSDSAHGAELSLDFHPDDSRRLWLRYDRTFRFPLIDEIAGYQGFLLDTPVNTSLGPETGHGVELGSSYHGERFGASLTTFAQWLDGEILFDFQNKRNRNFARSRRIGLESRLTWQGDHGRALVTHHWTSATFANGPFEGNDHPLVPRHQLSALLTWEIRDDLDLDLEWEWLSDAPEGGDFANVRAFLPGRSLVHLEGRQALGKHLEVFARIDNLFDERWASLKFLGQWYPGNGRALTLGLRGTF